MEEKLTRFIVIFTLLVAFVMVLSAAAQDEPTVVNDLNRSALICQEQGGVIGLDESAGRVIGECVFEGEPVYEADPFFEGKTLPVEPIEESTN